MGLTWDYSDDGDARSVFTTVLNELVRADGLGFDSAWIQESHESPAACSAPALMLTYASRKAPSIRLYAAGVRADAASLARTAESVAVLDVFSRGRAGIAFAAASRLGIEPEFLHEAIDFVTSAWYLDEFRYRGQYVRFPAHIPEDAPPGASTPTCDGDYVPQWERGPDVGDYLAVTPKPLAPLLPVHVEIRDTATLEWAARRGIGAYVTSEVSTTGALDLITRYREVAHAASRPVCAADVVLERYIELDGERDDSRLGGSPSDLVDEIRSLRDQARFSHLVWRRPAAPAGRSDEMFRFASEVQPLLQA